MQKLFILSLFTFFCNVTFAQQHFLDYGTLAPCGYTGNPKISMVTENVTVLLLEEVPVHAHIGGKVVSIFKVGDEYNVVIKTHEDFYVNFGNLKAVNVNRGEVIQKSTAIGLPLPGIKSGTWELMISYNLREGSLPCEQAIEMIRLSKVNEIVMRDFSK